MLVLTSLAKYKESAGGHTRQENMQQAKRMTEQLARRIPTLEQVEVGLNLTNQPLPTDFDSSSRFVYKDQEALQRTIAHPAHSELITFLQEVLESNHMVLYEIN